MANASAKKVSRRLRLVLIQVLLPLHQRFKQADQRHFAVQQRVADRHRRLSGEDLIISVCGSSRKSGLLLS